MSVLTPISYDRKHLNRIYERTVGFKILLKTKDDHWQLERWIKHHANIVGMENLVIFDNSTTDERAVSILRMYQDIIPVIRFEGFHNYIHDTARAPEIYEAIKATTDYFLFLDTDEYLVRLTDTEFQNDTQLLTPLSDNTAPIIPCTWLYNSMNSETIFVVGQNFDKLMNGIKWGKPIIRSNACPNGYLNHNVQIKSDKYTIPFPNGYFLLHMAQFPEQRIAANIKKLVARHVVMSDITAEEVGQMDFSKSNDPNVRLYVDEIIRLTGITTPEGARDEVLRSGCVKLAETHEWHGFSNVERDLLRNYIHLDQQTLLTTAFRAA